MGKVNDLKTFEDKFTWRGKDYKLIWHDVDSFEGLDPKNTTQCYGVCFCGSKIVIGRGVKGAWTLIGGTIEKDEVFEDTLKREIKEESNMKVLKFAPIGYQEVFKDNGSSICQLRYVCKVEPFGEFESDPAEDGIVEIKLVDPSEFKNYFDWGKVGETIINRALEIKSSW